MHITIIAAGTRGDTQPYVALGAALKKTGQQVRIATFNAFEPLVRGNGLDFFPVQGDIVSIASSAETEHARKADNPLKLVMSFNKLKHLAAQLQDDFFNACADTDLVVYHPGAAISYFAAQHFGIPSVLATPFPMTPTREYPSLIFYVKPRLGGSYNLLTHKVLEQIMWTGAKSLTRQYWITKFGKLPADFGCPFGRQITPSHPTIVSSSDHVFPRPADWPEHVQNTGYWFLEEEQGWKPPQALLEFLANGSKPVYVGFGSLGDRQNVQQTTQLVLEALSLSGQRGVLATGWSGMAKPEGVPQSVFFLDSIPHSWLFPRMAVVVHHGGAGTTAAAFNAGVPQLVIPFSNDQFAWGKRVEELGVGPRAIQRKVLTSGKLSNGIQLAMSDSICQKAQVLGTKIRAESGADNAAGIILNAAEAFRKEH